MSAPMEEKEAWRLIRNLRDPHGAPETVADALAIAEDWERARAAEERFADEAAQARADRDEWRKEAEQFEAENAELRKLLGALRTWFAMSAPPHPTAAAGWVHQIDSALEKNGGRSDG